MVIEAVVFDFDGVIVDSEPIGLELDRLLLQRHGISLTHREVADLFLGRTEQHRLSELTRLLGAAPEPEADAESEGLYERMFDVVETIVGVTAALDAIPLRKAIASNNGRLRIQRSLRRFGLGHHFEDRIAVRADVPRGKPAPDVYLRAAEILEVEPSHCVAVEDSRPGIEAASTAGLHVFGLANDYTSAADIRAAGAVAFERMSDLPGLIQGLTAADPPPPHRA